MPLTLETEQTYQSTLRHSEKTGGTTQRHDSSASVNVLVDGIWAGDIDPGIKFSS